jgi:hypothetical protein
MVTDASLDVTVPFILGATLMTTGKMRLDLALAIRRQGLVSAGVEFRPERFTLIHHCSLPATVVAAESIPRGSKSDKCSRSMRRPRDSRDITVPSGQSVM